MRVAGGDGNFLEIHIFQDELNKNLVVENEVVRVGQPVDALKRLATKSAVSGMKFGELRLNMILNWSIWRMSLTNSMTCLRMPRKIPYISIRKATQLRLK